MNLLDCAKVLGWRRSGGGNGWGRKGGDGGIASGSEEMPF